MNESLAKLVILGSGKNAIAVMDAARAHGVPFSTVSASGAAVIVVAMDSMNPTEPVFGPDEIEHLRALLDSVKHNLSAAILLCVGPMGELMTTVAAKLSGLPAGRVIGIGTTASSRRFRELIAARLRIDAGAVQAFVAGADGAAPTPLWSSAVAATVPLHLWAVQGHGKLAVRDRIDITRAAKAASSHEDIGNSACEIVQAIIEDRRKVLPVSIMLQNFRGISGVCLSLPCIVGSAGATGPLPIPMNEAESAGLENTAQLLAEALTGLGK